MIDFGSIVLSFMLATFGGFLGVMFGVWFTKKYMFSGESIMDMADSVLTYATQTKEGQEKLNILGKWVVSNLMSSVQGNVKGMMPKTKDLPGLLIYAAIQKFAPNLFGGQQAQQQQNPPPQQNSQPERF